MRDFTGVELQCENPAELAEKWAHIADVPVSSENGRPVITLKNTTLRFVGIEDGRGPGLGGVDLAVNNRDEILTQAKKRDAYVNDNQVMVCGTRFYLI